LNDLSLHNIHLPIGANPATKSIAQSHAIKLDNNIGDMKGERRKRMIVSSGLLNYLNPGNLRQMSKSIDKARIAFEIGSSRRRSK